LRDRSRHVGPFSFHVRRRDARLRYPELLETRPGPIPLLFYPPLPVQPRIRGVGVRPSSSTFHLIDFNQAGGKRFRRARRRAGPLGFPEVAGGRTAPARLR